MTSVITANRRVQQTRTWPQMLAYIAATLFALASGATNLLYGLAKGTSFPTCLVWAAVAVGTSLIFLLSWPALIGAAEKRQWSRAAAALAALLLTGTYSVCAALGSASATRMDAGAAELATTDVRQKAQSAYDSAKAELDGLKSSRPVAELEPLIVAVKPVCRVMVTNGAREMICTKPPALTAELGRAKRRAELEGKLEKATADLVRAGPPKAANTDAKILSRFFGAIGIDASPDRLSDLLTLLAILVIECGGGLSLTVGLALGNAEQPSAKSDGAFAGSIGGQNTLPFAERTANRPLEQTTLNRPPDAAKSLENTAFQPPNTDSLRSPSANVQTEAGARLLGFVRERGGVLVSGQRQIGKALGWSPSWTHAVLHGLSDAGLIKLTTGRTGTVVQLAA